MKSPRYEDPSAKLWYSYLTEAEKHDCALAQSWKGDMDAILIFAGLFSASVTAFIIESYRSLLPNTDDKVILLLARISDQLVSASNGSHPASVVPDILDAKFTPTAAALVCNTLWFLSLGFSLICALSATLVQQWTRNYIQATETRSTPQRRARISAFLYRGLNRFKMAALVEIIPLLLHISLLLFLGGLFAYLLSVNDALAYLILAITVLCSALYALITFLPVFHYDCPYHTPLSLLSWRILCSLRLLRQRDSLGVLQPIVCGMSEARETAAVEISSERDARDFDAMCWAIELLRVDNELEPFIEVIPNVVACTDLSAKLLLYRLLNHDAVTVRLGYRIQRLLVTCTQGELAPARAQKRATMCLSAIWSLTMMSLPASPATTSTAYRSRETLHFDEQTLKYINLVQSGIPSVSDYSVSALTVVSRSLLDMYLDQILKLETDIGGFVATRRWYHHEPGHDTHLAHRHPDLVLKRLHQQLDKLEAHLSCSHQVFTLPCTTMENVHRHLEELVDIAVSTSSTEELVELALEFTHQFRHALNQAGFSLTTEFTAYLLKSPTLPYEATNTLRRLFLTIDYDIPLSVESQSLFVDQLDEALEPHPLPGGSRLPESVINILQGMVPAVSDASCKLKAVRSIHLHKKRFPSNDAASKALVHLRGDHSSSPPPPLDLFGSHMYTNIKLDKTGTWTARVSGGTEDGGGLDAVLRGPSITRLPLLRSMQFPDAQ